MAYNSTAWTTDGNTNTTGGYSLYAYFGIGYSGASHYTYDTHYPLPFQGSPYITSSESDVDFGTGTNPDTSFTTADTDTQYAGQISPMIWYVPDNIVIDAVYSLEGADNATGGTTRMHLMSFDYTSGSTSTLANGQIIASNSDVTNAGNEQTYLSTFTIDSSYSSVSSGKAILAFFRVDSSVASDYSASVTIKYHLS